jgi:hypothetical protein
MWPLEPHIYYLLSDFLHFPVHLLQLLERLAPDLIHLRRDIRALPPVHPLCLLESAGHIALYRRLSVLYLGQLPLKHTCDLLQLRDLGSHLPLKKFHLLLALVETLLLIAD